MKHLKSGNILLKVYQGEKTVFPKVDTPGRREVMDIMYKSQEYKHSVTFDIVKLGQAYDKNKLSRLYGITARKKAKSFQRKPLICLPSLL